MQQTEHLKLNLIETGDPISPAPINENAEKLEAALLTKADALDARVTTLEVHKIAVGTYNGASEPQIIEVGFTPRAVIVNCSKPSITYMALAVTNASPVGGTNSITVRITDGGFRVAADFNYAYNTYHYIAIV